MSEKLREVELRLMSMGVRANKDVDYLFQHIEKQQERFDILTHHHDAALAKVNELEEDSKKLAEAEKAMRDMMETSFSMGMSSINLKYNNEVLSNFASSCFILGAKLINKDDPSKEEKELLKIIDDLDSRFIL